ncbi:unnamed protein product [Amoebophrya sp. A25]|nr:unnamed protein product [Amoebophrya sp. A25]|eukprot:GSA25T00009632001.1
MLHVEEMKLKARRRNVVVCKYCGKTQGLHAQCWEQYRLASASGLGTSSDRTTLLDGGPEQKNRNPLHGSFSGDAHTVARCHACRKPDGLSGDRERYWNALTRALYWILERKMPDLFSPPLSSLLSGEPGADPESTTTGNPSDPKAGAAEGNIRKKRMVPPKKRVIFLPDHAGWLPKHVILGPLTPSPQKLEEIRQSILLSPTCAPHFFNAEERPQEPPADAEGQGIEEQQQQKDHVHDEYVRTAVLPTAEQDKAARSACWLVRHPIIGVPASRNASQENLTTTESSTSGGCLTTSSTCYPSTSTLEGQEGRDSDDSSEEFHSDGGSRDFTIAPSEDHEEGEGEGEQHQDPAPHVLEDKDDDLRLMHRLRALSIRDNSLLEARAQDAADPPTTDRTQKCENRSMRPPETEYDFTNLKSEDRLDNPDSVIVFLVGQKSLAKFKKRPYEAYDLLDHRGINDTTMDVDQPFCTFKEEGEEIVIGSPPAEHTNNFANLGPADLVSAPPLRRSIRAFRLGGKDENHELEESTDVNFWLKKKDTLQEMYINMLPSSKGKGATAEQAGQGQHHKMKLSLRPGMPTLGEIILKQHRDVEKGEADVEGPPASSSAADGRGPRLGFLAPSKKLGVSLAGFFERASTEVQSDVDLRDNRV